ncbi:MAG: ATP-binding protein [Solirubrobacteraceae bacterium]
MARATAGHEIVPPNAAAMIESMRAFGYSPATAIADLVDNSITARARLIEVRMHWAGRDSWVSVSDDGRGMEEDELRNAMRLGSRSPREERAAEDLGRFGLGLKTASFSQCRSLTVASRRAAGTMGVRRWDLDVVAERGEWYLLTSAAPRSADRLDPIGLEQGTVVLLENLDRLAGDVDADDDSAREHFLQTAGRVETHLGMVFHRFLGTRGGPELRVNGNRVQPWDPFMADHPSTQRFQSEHLMLHGHRIEVSPFVLPHHSKLTDAERTAGRGPEGWNAHQGFYVYRERRLLVAGDWLRLGGQKEEHAKLARIRIDLPNGLDGEWQIDVRKATARPPGPLRDRLRQIAELTRRRAVEVYRHRGKEIARRHGGEQSFVWRQLVRRGKIVYAVNRDHPIVATALAASPGLESVLRLAEETVPVPLIALQATERPDEQAAPFEGADRDLRTLARSTRDVLLANGHDRRTVTTALLAIEPFASHPEILTALEDPS